MSARRHKVGPATLTTVRPRQDLNSSATTTRTIGRTSGRKVVDEVRRDRVHPELGSRNAHPTPEVADTTLTDHLRTSNPIESVFATVRHRTVRTKGALSQDTARLMVFKLVMAAAKTWRRLKGENQLPKVVQGVTFTNGVEIINTPAQSAA